MFENQPLLRLTAAVAAGLIIAGLALKVFTYIDDQYFQNPVALLAWMVGGVAVAMLFFRSLKCLASFRRRVGLRWFWKAHLVIAGLCMMFCILLHKSGAIPEYPVTLTTLWFMVFVAFESIYKWLFPTPSPAAIATASSRSTSPSTSPAHPADSVAHQ